MDYKIGALLIINAHIFTTLAQDSPCACTREFRPVCGSNGQTYNNPCLLRCAAHTSDKEIDVVKPIPCDDDPSFEEQSVEDLTACKICTFIYSPVCGSDGHTYPNECSLKCYRARFNHDVTVQYAGRCVTANPSDCLCTLIYAPVCGSNGRTYGNKCSLDCESVTNPQLRIVNDGPCDDT